MNRTTVGLIAILFGCFGVHHFMLGNTFKGIIYLLFFWISWVLGIIDGLAILAMTDEQFQSKYFSQPQSNVMTPSPNSLQMSSVININNAGIDINHSISNTDQVAKLHLLYKQGVITEEEFQYQKTKLLN